jgi:signal peptidase I
VADLVPSTDPPRGDPGDTGRPRPRARRGPRHRQQRKSSFWRELPILLVTALVLTFLIQTFLARVYVIPSASMEQTLQGCSGCTNDRVLVDKLVYRFDEPSPGDVVVFRGPASWAGSAEFERSEPDNVLLRGLQQAAALIGLAPPDERDFVKRVIAVGGQTVQCCDDQNRVLVADASEPAPGQPLTEPYVYLAGGQPQESFAPVTVPEGHLWVMGDNRNNSADSRRHVDDDANGTIPIGNVIGKTRAVVLPPDRWKGINDPNPQTAAALGTPTWGRH